MKRNQKTVKPAVTALMAAALTLVPLTGCTTAQTYHMKDIDYFNVDSYTWALNLDSALGKNATNHSYVAFVKADGSSQLLMRDKETGGRLIWDREGLYASDMYADYRVLPDGEVVSADARRAPLTRAVAAVQNSNLVAAVQAGTAEKDQSGQQVVLSEPRQSRSFTVPSDTEYSLLSACGLNVYAAKVESDNPGAGQSLWVDSILEASQPSHHYVASQPLPLFSADLAASDAPCWDGKIHFLATQWGQTVTPGFSDQSEEFSQLAYRDADNLRIVPALGTIDTLHRTIHFTPLRQADGRVFRTSAADLRVAAYSSQSLSLEGDEGVPQLYWINGDGQVLRTNIQSGVTETLPVQLPGATEATSSTVEAPASTPEVTGESSPKGQAAAAYTRYYLTASTDALTILSVTVGQAEKAATITKISKRDGSQILQRKVTGLEKVEADIRIAGIAENPAK
ncbi:hypothetical protein [Boudabousia marimammalium]|uniref:Lipoprotein n=1 Tax=Boudabousia marimammalium TaxID=156892 RepID=A0A1Q5PSJ5_9ACTO|nr:hypothetical protein [Boudabousia marimammalium]OKL50415.1 hypothetical protein BM477_00080 [Boudabousia marimammalium]